jgi:hypothetical protein
MMLLVEAVDDELDRDRFIDGQFCVIDRIFPVSMVQLCPMEAKEGAEANNCLYGWKRGWRP